MKKQRIHVPINMKLRCVDDDDHEFLIDLHNDPEVLKNLTHPNPITPEQHKKWWNQILDDQCQLRLIFDVDDQRVGFAKFYAIDNHNKNCVLGADITREFRGKGLSKYMWTLMLDTCFDVIGCHRVSLTTASYNEIGQRVYKQLGFKEEGRLIQSLYRNGQYHDQIMMYLLKDDRE